MVFMAMYFNYNPIFRLVVIPAGKMCFNQVLLQWCFTLYLYFQQKVTVLRYPITFFFSAHYGIDEI